LARETGNAGGARACIPNGKVKWFYHTNLSSYGTVQSTLGVGGCGHEIFASATCQLQFAKASAVTLSQQERNGTADVQRGRVHISGFIGTVVSKPSRRCTFGELESLAVALRRAFNH
jgi:hypothetical protein